MNRTRFTKVTVVGLLALGASTASQAASDMPADDGLVAVKSAYPVGETVARLKADIAAKGITFFDQIDQAKLAQAAAIDLRPSTLLIFGNPPLGIQFLTSNPRSGIDWPVRLLVTEDAGGQVWAVYSDFEWIARRYGITDRGPQFAMASKVIGSITSSVAEP